jgi:hypothetical protein
MVQGKYVILVIFGTALAMAIFAWQFRIAEGNDVLDYWGVESANLLRHANKVEFLKLDSENVTNPSSMLNIGGAQQNIVSVEDISLRKGLIHARHMFIVDHTYLWEESPPENIQNWTFALRFSDGDKRATLAFHSNSHAVQMVDNNKPLIMGAMFKNLLHYLAPILEPSAE